MSFRDRTLPRLALIGVLVTALGLAACGRKGPLDLPPAASAEAAQGSAGTGSAAPEPKKPLPIDVLLN
jgi:predicted small lipoprotein YifL